MTGGVVNDGRKDAERGDLRYPDGGGRMGLRADLREAWCRGALLCWGGQGCSSPPAPPPAAPRRPTPSPRAVAPLRAGGAPSGGGAARAAGAGAEAGAGSRSRSRSGAEPGRSGPCGPSQQPSWGRGRAACTGPGRRGRGRSPAARGALGSSAPGSSGTCFKMSPSWTGSCGSAGR